MAPSSSQTSSDGSPAEFREPTVVRDPLIGQVVEQYLVRDFVGEGTMGVVYRAVDTESGREVVLKLLRSEYAEDPTMIARIIEEAQALTSIRHPGIVDILGFGQLASSGQPYIVMEHVSGVRLDDFIRQHAPMSPRAAFPILDQLLSALAAAHAVGVIHRDVKPGNMVLDGPSNARRLKLLDFGLARRDEERVDMANGASRPTNPGSILGTPDFMAPEQVGGGPVRPSTDLYAVGGIAYQMLTGRLPHEGPSAIDVIVAKMKRPPPPLRGHSPHLGVEVEAWVLRLLERDPERRPQSAGEVRAELASLVEERGTDPNIQGLVRRPPRAALDQSPSWTVSTVVQTASPPGPSSPQRHDPSGTLAGETSRDTGAEPGRSQADTGPDSTSLEETLTVSPGSPRAAALREAATRAAFVKTWPKVAAPRGLRTLTEKPSLLWAGAGLAILLVFAVIGFLLGRAPSR